MTWWLIRKQTLREIMHELQKGCLETSTSCNEKRICELKMQSSIVKHLHTAELDLQRFQTMFPLLENSMSTEYSNVSEFEAIN